jgi:hypothetical protein
VCALWCVVASRKKWFFGKKKVWNAETF